MRATYQRDLGRKRVVQQFHQGMTVFRFPHDARRAVFLASRAPCRFFGHNEFYG